MEYNKYIDHTLLKADATKGEIDKLIKEAIKYDFKAVCLNPSWIEYARRALAGGDTLVCTVVGFPLGQMTTSAKVSETKNAIKVGAEEVDMVANITWIKESNTEMLTKEIKKIKKAVGKKTLKVIIETALLTKKEIEFATEIVMTSGADFVKTSTGFSTRGASFDDIKLMKKVAGDVIGIKAAGGVRTLDDMKKMIKLGATRIGTSRGVDLMMGTESKGNKY